MGCGGKPVRDVTVLPSDRAVPVRVSTLGRLLVTDPFLGGMLKTLVAAQARMAKIAESSD